jgi:glycosyltransferase involved in cell wall biosynthesis
MRIVFDARSYFMRTGIARYTRGLAHALAASPGRHQWLFLISDHHQPDELDFGSSAVEVRQSHAPWLGGASERGALAREASEWSADLFHAVFPPHALATVPTITTVFDFSPFSHPELHQDAVRSAFGEAWASAEADARGFIAVSSATADQVRTRAGQARPIWTIPCGLSAPFDVPPTGSEAAEPREGVLCVGTIEPRKNFALILAASRRLHDNGRRIPVTLIGKRGWGYEAFDRDLAAAPDARWLGYADDEALLGHYRRAAIAACPSVLEGFGLPTLEAMAQGALPLIAPDPALIQLVGRSDLAVPLDASAWAEAIARWLDDHPARESAVRETTATAQQYRWPAIAEQCLPLYDAF